jgi:cyclase
MTLKKRIIVTLLWDGRQVVKPVGFERPYRKLGSLMQYIRVIEKRNIDELILIDIEASPQKREPNWEAIREVTSQIYCPLTYGGGIKTLDHIKEALNSGADKVAMRGALREYGFTVEASRKFGSQAIVACYDYFKNADNICIDGTSLTPYLCNLLGQRGVGEILLTDVEKDGTLNGYNLNLIRDVSRACSIPIIASGGCGNISHCLEAIEAGADAVAAGSMYLYTDTTPRDVAKYLYENNVPVRYESK